MDTSYLTLALKLPSFLEPHREEIEGVLPELEEAETNADLSVMTRGYADQRPSWAGEHIGFMPFPVDRT